MKYETENPWDVQSLFDFQFFNCPSCVFKVKSGQEFLDHAYQNHVESTNFLPNISDGSIEALECTWNDIKEEPEEEEVEEIYLETAKEPDQEENEKKECSEPEKVLNSKPYCQPCNSYFSSISALEKHKQIFHIVIRTEKPSFTSDKRPEDKTLEILSKVSNSANVKKCESCNIYFSSSETLQKHRDDQHPTDIVFDASNENAILPEEQTIPCDVCKTKLKQKKGDTRTIAQILEDHKKTDHDLKCKFCGKLRWKDRTALDKHIEKHHKQVICSECGKTYENERKYKLHLQNTHDAIYPCQHCKKRFSTEKSKLYHEQNVCSGVFACEKCGKVVANPSSLLQHMKNWHSDEKNYACKICDKRFNLNWKLTHHIRAVHEKIRNHICDQCPFASAQKQSLIKHIQVVHEKRKDHKCDVCEKAFGTPFQLRCHKVKYHNIGKVYPCEQCDIRFPSGGALKRHMRAVHSDVKDFQCNECGKWFNNNGNLTIHTNSVHRGIRHKCPVCDREFVRKIQMERHLLDVHHQTLETNE